MNIVVFILLVLLTCTSGEDDKKKSKTKNKIPREKRQLIYIPFLPNSNFYAPPTAPSIMAPKMIFQSKMYFPQPGYANAPNGQASFPSQFHGHNSPVTAAITMVPNFSIEGLGNILGHGPNNPSNSIGNIMGIKVLNSGQASGITVTTGHSFNNGQAIGQIVGNTPFIHNPALYANSQQSFPVGQDLSGHALNGQFLGNQVVEGHSLNQQAYNGLGGRSYDGPVAVTASHPAYGVISQIMHASPYM